MLSWLNPLLAAAAWLSVLWLLLLLVLWLSGRGRVELVQAMRLLPDLLRLASRLARDRSLPIGVRARMWLLLGYLASPLDLVPDFVPVAGYADDAIVLAWALRSVVRAAGTEALARNWPGRDADLVLVLRLAGLGPRSAGQRRQERSSPPEQAGQEGTSLDTG